MTAEQVELDIDALRALRTQATQGAEAQTAVMQTAGTVDQLTRLSECTEGPWATVALQVAHNACVGHPANQQLLWGLCFPRHFGRLLRCSPAAVRYLAAALLHLCTRHSPSRLHDLLGRPAPESASPADTGFRVSVSAAEAKTAGEEGAAEEEKRRVGGEEEGGKDESRADNPIDDLRTPFRLLVAQCAQNPEDEGADGSSCSQSRGSSSRDSSHDSSRGPREPDAVEWLVHLTRTMVEEGVLHKALALVGE